jgi:hypothetical protein
MPFPKPGGGGGAVSSVFTRIGAIAAVTGDYTVTQITGAAPLASPPITGTPTAPTAVAGTNTTQLANTAFVTAAVSAGTGTVSSVFGRTGVVVATTGDFAVTQVTGAAPLASPTFTGTVTVPIPVNPTDAATKAYADGLAAGLSIKASCQEGTTTALPANTYLAGVITITATGVLTVDGRAVALNDRVLVKDEATQANNGIYTCTTAGSTGVSAVLTRSTDMNTGTQIPGAFTFIEAGTVNTGAGFVVASVGPYTIGTTPIVFTKFSSNGGITQLTGDVTAGPGTGSVATTLASSGVTPGTYGSASLIPVITTDAKGRVTAVTTAAPATSVGAQLANVSYGPSVQVFHNLTATTLTAIDTTNLTIAFTVPASGKIKIRASAFLYCQPGSGAGNFVLLTLGFLNHSGGVQVGPKQQQITMFTQAAGANDPTQARCVYEATISGLTPGALQLDLAGLYSGNVAITAAAMGYDDGVTGSNSDGPVELTVFAQ